MIQKPVRQNQSTTEQLFYWERTWYTKLALTTLTYLFRKIKPKLSKETKPIVMSHRCRNFTLFLAQIPLSRVQSRYLERHVKGRHEDISQCKIVNEKNWWWCALRSIYLLHKEPAHYQVWKRGKSKWRIFVWFFLHATRMTDEKIFKKFSRAWKSLESVNFFWDNLCRSDLPRFHTRQCAASLCCQ